MLRLSPGWFAIVIVCSSAVCGCELAQNYTDPNGPRYSGEYAPDPSAISILPELKLVTFNIQFGNHVTQATAELQQRQALSNADLILLQEMDPAGTDAIAKELQQNYVYYPGSVQHGKDFGNAVLSRWPIVSDQKIILPHRNPTDGRIRICVAATVRTPYGDLRAYSVHNETPWLGPRGRLEQAETIVNHARSSEFPVAVAGDFNTSDPGSLDATVSLWEAAGFTWASSDSGDTAGSFVLDSTFTRDFDALASGTVATDASDHRPQWVHVELLH